VASIVSEYRRSITIAFYPGSLQNRKTGAGRNLSGPMIVDTDKAFDAPLAVITDRPLFAYESKAPSILRTSSPNVIASPETQPQVRVEPLWLKQKSSLVEADLRYQRRRC
jgi:hypothetical protein